MSSEGAPGLLTRHLALAGLGLLALFPVALSLREFTPVGVYAFWGLVALVAVVATALAVRTPDSIVPALLVGNALALTKIFILPQPFQLWGTDAFAETSVANAIVSAGHWAPSQGLGAAANYYGYFPAVHLLLAVQSQVTSLGTLVLSKYAFILVFTNLVIAVGYLILKALAKGTPALQALTPSKLGLLYALSLGVVGIFVSRRLVGFTAVMLLILLVTDSRLRDRQLYIVPFLAALLAISDHLSVYAGLPIFALFAVARWRSGHTDLKPLLIVGFAVALWYGLVAWPDLIMRDLTTFSRALAQLTASPAGLSRQVQIGQTVLERTLPYLTQALVAALGLAGLFLAVRRVRRHEFDRATAALLASLYVIYVGIVVLFATSLAFLVNSVELVGALGICMLFLLGYEQITGPAEARGGRARRGRSLLLMAVVAILLSGNLLALVSARYVDSVGNSRTTIDDVQIGTPAVWSGGGWLSTFDRGGRVYADQVVQALYAAENVSTSSHSYALLTSAAILGRVMQPNSSFVYLTASTTLQSTNYPGDFPLAQAHVSSLVDGLGLGVVFADPDVQVWYRA